MATRLLIASQEFKGTLTSRQATEAISRGVRTAWPQASLDLAPLADGGPGLVDAYLLGVGGARQVTQVDGPLGEPVQAAWALSADGLTAVLEMASASGLSLLSPAARDVMRATTRGTGQLILAALSAGARTVLVGLGGSATVDGGLGALIALGAMAQDTHGNPLSGAPAELSSLARFDGAPAVARLGGAELIAAVDVENPLLGPTGAAPTFGPQKGATPAQVEALEASLSHFASLVGPARAFEPGMGAAGGLAFGLAAAAGARVVSGFQFVADALGLPSRVLAADWVLTGEGRLDAQSARGKGPWALAELAASARKPAVLFTGELALPEGLATPFCERVAAPADERGAADVLERAAHDWAARRAPSSA